jgi:hypothetical protein
VAGALCLRRKLRHFVRDAPGCPRVVLHPLNEIVQPIAPAHLAALR